MDDLALVEAGEPQLRASLDLAEQVAGWAAISLMPGNVPVTALIVGALKVSLSLGQEYCHVGVPNGFKVTEIPEQDIARMREGLCRTDESLGSMAGAGWQKLVAVRTIVLTRLDFILTGTRVAKGPLT